LGQKHGELVLTRAEFYALASAHDGLLGEIDGQIFYDQQVVFFLGLGAAAQQGHHAQVQFVKVKRLGEVVVGSVLKGFHFVLNIAVSRKHQDGRASVGFTDSAAHVQAIHFGDVDVEQENIVGVAAQLPKKRFAVKDTVAGETFMGQKSAGFFRQHGVVF
jgi:hypothetical protein